MPAAGVKYYAIIRPTQSVSTGCMTYTAVIRGHDLKEHMPRPVIIMEKEGIGHAARGENIRYVCAVENGVVNAGGLIKTKRSCWCRVHIRH